MAALLFAQMCFMRRCFFSSLRSKDLGYISTFSGNFHSITIWCVHTVCDLYVSYRRGSSKSSQYPNIECALLHLSNIQWTINGTSTTNPQSTSGSSAIHLTTVSDLSDSLSRTKPLDAPSIMGNSRHQRVAMFEKRSESSPPQTPPRRSFAPIFRRVPGAVELASIVGSAYRTIEGLGFGFS